MQESSQYISKTIKQCEELVSTAGKKAPPAATTELQNALANLKVTQKKLTDTQVKALNTSASLEDADTLFREADEAKQLFSHTEARWNMLKEVVLNGPDFTKDDKILNLKNFFRDYNVQPANIAALDKFFFKDKNISAVAAEADKMINSRMKALHAPVAHANQKIMNAQHQVRPVLNNLLAMKHELDADIRVLYKQLVTFNRTLKGTPVYADAVARFDKLTHSIAACRYQVLGPLRRGKLMFHGAAPHSANKPNPSARAIIQTAPPQPGTSAPLKSYWDAETTADQLKRVKDLQGNPAMDFHDVDVVQLNMCHGAAGGDQSFAAEFSRIIGKPVKANTGVQTVNYSVDTIEKLATEEAYLTHKSLPTVADDYTMLLNNKAYLRSSKLPPNPKLHDVTYDAHWFFPPGTNGPQTHPELKQLLQFESGF